MRTVFLVVSLAAATVLAQQTAPPAVSERVDINVVNVDVTVLDHSGKPVVGLTKADFEVLEDGKQRPISNFSAAMASVPAAAAAEKPAETEIPAVARSQRRNVVVLVDETSDDVAISDAGVPTVGMKDKLQRNQALARVEELADRFGGDSQWSVVTIGWKSTVTDILPFTTDRQALRNAIDSVRRGVTPPSARRFTVDPARMHLGSLLVVEDRPACTSAGNSCFLKSFTASSKRAQEMRRAAHFFATVIQTARAMAWMPGEKVVLLVSARLPLFTAGGFDEGHLAESYQMMMKEANAANTRVYVLDPQGVSTDLDMSTRASAVAFEMRGTSGAYWLATNTGGIYLQSNRVDESLQKFEAATTRYYEIGFRTGSDDGKFHRITVRLTKPNKYAISYRNGYVRLSRDEAFEKALANPFGIASQRSTLPVTMTIGEKKEDGKLTVLPVRIHVPTAGFTRIQGTGQVHVYITVFTADGDNVAFKHTQETVDGSQESLLIHQDIALHPANYRIFVVIRDAVTEEVGVAAQEVGL